MHHPNTSILKQSFYSYKHNPYNLHKQYKIVQNLSFFIKYSIRKYERDIFQDQLYIFLQYTNV